MIHREKAQYDLLNVNMDDVRMEERKEKAINFLY